MDAQTLKNYIDNTYLNPAATQENIEKLCREAVEFQFYSVCVNPRWLKFAAPALENSHVKICSVVSFPYGADTTKIKAAQTKEAIFDGADEIDVVADLSAIVQGEDEYLLKQLESVLKPCRSMRPAVLLKVIIESAALTKEQIVFASQICQKAGVDFIKTSTGTHAAGGAKIEDIMLIKETAPFCKIKASGGIKTAAQATAMIQAGAARIGTSSAVQIIEELKSGIL